MYVQNIHSSLKHGILKIHNTYYVLVDQQSRYLPKTLAAILISRPRVLIKNHHVDIFIWKQSA